MMSYDDCRRIFVALSRAHTDLSEAGIHPETTAELEAAMHLVAAAHRRKRQTWESEARARIAARSK